MTAYVVFMAVGFFFLNEKVESADADAVSLDREIFTLRARLAQFQLVAADLLRVSGFTAETAENELRKLAKSKKELLARMANEFPENSAAVAELSGSFEPFRQKLEEIKARLAAGESAEEEVSELRGIVDEAVSRLDVSLSTLSRGAESMSEELRSELHARLVITAALGTFFGLAIIGAAIWVDKSNKKKDNEIAKRENLLSQIAANVDNVFIMAANADDFKFVSENSGRVTRLSASVLRKNPRFLYDLFGGEDAKWLKSVLESGENLIGPCEREASSPKLERFFNIRVYPTCVIADREEQFIVCLSDRTQAARHRQALGAALDAARAASFAKSEFLSHMSHEMRTPMNAIIGMTAIARSRISNAARVTDCLNKIDEASQRLMGVINDILDMSKIENGKLSIERQNFNLFTLMDGVTQIARRQTQARKQKLEIRYEDVDEEDLIGDSRRLRQILLNILSNAWKFTPQGGRINVEVRGLAKTGSRVFFRFTIADTGIGMSEEFLRRVYEPFEQAARSTESKQGGVGLGMPIAYNLVSLMGGSIDVRSEEGKGTVFTVELSFISDGDAAKPGTLPALKTLVVDGDEEFRADAYQLLKRLGCRVDEAASVEEAIKHLRVAEDASEPVDVALVENKLYLKNKDLFAKTAAEIIVLDGEGEELNASKPLTLETLYDVVTAAAEKTRKAAETPAETRETNFAGRRFLVVDDNDFNREILREFLEMVNAEVEVAEDGEEAVKKILDSPQGYYDATLMDLKMPVMDGVEATRRIRNSAHPDARTMPIIAVTANCFPEDVANARAAGMDAHLAKPVDVRKLYALIDERLSVSFDN